jgi:translation initiation factor IF-3
LEAIKNESIHSLKVRLIDENGGQVGVVDTSVARKQAEAAGLDLVVVATESEPPVAKIMDYSKYRYELEMKKRLTRRNTGSADLKEVRFRLRIDDHDFEMKIGQASKFLKGGDKVKMQIQFRGREQQHPQMGVDLLDRVADALKELGTIATRPTMEGRNISMIMQPNAKKEHTISEQRRRGGEVKSARADRQARRLAAKGIDASGKKIVTDGKENKKGKEKDNAKK